MAKNKRKIIIDMLFEVYDKGIQSEECNLDFYYEKMMQTLNIPCVIKSVCDNCGGDFFVTTINGGKKCNECGKPVK